MARKYFGGFFIAYCSLLCILIVSNTIEARRIKYRPGSTNQPQVAPRSEEETEAAASVRPTRVQYYAAVDPQELEEGSSEQEAQQHQQIGGVRGTPVLVTNTDELNGLYGQIRANHHRNVQDNYIVAPKVAALPIKQRVKEPEKPAPVQTIRNYNKVNDDGSFTFGYEAADGSFKEETRGTDCVVRGKYGYIDPDGNKREFTYVSGNPCDPNNKDSDEDNDNEKSEEDRESSDEEANYPKHFPVKAAVRARPAQVPQARPVAYRPALAPARPTVTVFQNDYKAESTESDEDEQPEALQVLRPSSTIRPQNPSVSYVHHARPETTRPVVHYQPYSQGYSSTTQTPVTYQHSSTAVPITPRPVTARTKLPATTYRPQLLQVSVTPRPSELYNKAYTRPQVYQTSTPLVAQPTKSAGSVDFDTEFQKFAQENNILVSTQGPLLKSTSEKAKVAAQAQLGGDQPIYTSELVYDPATGQYNTQLYQAIPQTSGDFTLTQKLQPYVAQPQQQLVHHQTAPHVQPLTQHHTQHVQPQPPRLLHLQQLQQTPLYKHYQQQQVPQQQSQLHHQAAARPQLTTNQQLYQQQQAEAQFANSQHLYAQQQKQRQNAALMAAAAAAAAAQSSPYRSLGSYASTGARSQGAAASASQPQQFYYIQAPANGAGQHQPLTTGQIESFLRSHNIQY